MVGESTQLSSGAANDIATQCNEDPLYLHSSDHSGMTLVTSPLIGENYLSWSRSIKIVL